MSKIPAVATAKPPTKPATPDLEKDSAKSLRAYFDNVDFSASPFEYEEVAYKELPAKARKAFEARHLADGETQEDIEEIIGESEIYQAPIGDQTAFFIFYDNGSGFETHVFAASGREVYDQSGQHD